MMKKMKMLSSANYVPVRALDVDFDRMIQDYRDVVAAFQEITGFEGLAAAMLKPLKNVRPHDFVSQLDRNVKSHNGPGDVEMRPIHSSAGHPFAPGMQFLSNVISDKLEKYAHILRDSDDLVEKLSGVFCL